MWVQWQPQQSPEPQQPQPLLRQPVQQLQQRPVQWAAVVAWPQADWPEPSTPVFPVFPVPVRVLLVGWGPVRPQPKWVRVVPVSAQALAGAWPRSPQGQNSAAAMQLADQVDRLQHRRLAKVCKKLPSRPARQPKATTMIPIRRSRSRPHKVSRTVVVRLGLNQKPNSQQVRRKRAAVLPGIKWPTR